MKRINLTFALTILLILSFSITSFASSEYFNPVNLFEDDPDFFELTAEEQANTDLSSLYSCGKICIEYTHVNGRRVRSYVSVYSSYENFAAYTYQEVGSSGTTLDYLVYNHNYYDVAYLKCGADINDSNFIKLTRYIYEYNSSTKRGLIFSSYTYSGSSTIPNFTSNVIDMEIISSDFPIFATEEDYINYREYGIIKNAIYNPADSIAASKFTPEQVYLDDFQCIYHDAPGLDNCYVEFKYSIPQHLRSSKGSIYLDVSDIYKLHAKCVAGLANADREYFGMSIFSVTENPYGFSIPVTDFSSVMQFVDNESPEKLSFVAKREVLGNEILFDFDNVSIDNIGLNTLLEITKSQLFLDVQVRVGPYSIGTKGEKYSALVDFLDLSNCYYESSSYDDKTETYKPNNDTVKDGYYSVDAGGNYNYHSSDGKTTSITSYDYNNSTNSTQYITNNYYCSSGVGSSGSGGEYININPVDFNQFVKGMKNMLEQFDTKGGLFLLIKDVFSMYPPDVTVIIVGAISTITIVSIICILRR